MDSSIVLRYERGDGPDERKRKVIAALAKTTSYWSARRAVKEACLAHAGALDVPDMLAPSPMASRLRCVVHSLDREASRALDQRSAGDGDAFEPLEIVESARYQWDTRTRYQLRAMGAKQQRPMIAPRRKLASGRADPEPPELLPTKLVYGWVDLLDALEALVNPNAAATFSNLRTFGLIKVSLKTPTLATLRVRYVQLSPDVRQAGLDDEQIGLEWFKEQKFSEGERLLVDARVHIDDIRRYAQTGIPPSMRPRLWKRLLGVWSSERDFAYYERLIAQVRQWNMLTDDLYRLEVQETSDHAAYFVFEEMLDEMMLAFSRDAWIPANSALPINLAPLTTPIRAEAPATTPRETMYRSPLAADEAPAPGDTGLHVDELGQVHIPPSQVVPFHQQVMLAAPVCYLFQRPEHCYFVFRQMYARYFSRLHLISSRPDTILYLSKLFEDLVQDQSPQAFYHAVEMGMPPLRVVFPWMFTAFSGYLAVDQVLSLWDRILAYDSLELVAILAASIFLFRSKSVLNAKSASEIRDVFEDCAYFHVLPLLQHFLYGDNMESRI